MKNTHADSTVYAIRNTVNGRVYVGCTVDLETRIRSHFLELQKGEKKHTVSPGVIQKTDWQLDYDKYGRDVFKCYVLESDIPEAKRELRENFWVMQYHATDPQFGYNLKLPMPPKNKVVFEEGLPPIPLMGGETA